TSNQLEFLMSEINSGYPGGKALMNAQSAEAARAAEKRFIGWDHAGTRHSYAQQIQGQDWFKYKGYVPSEFTNINNLKNSIKDTYSKIKQANVEGGTTTEAFEFDLLDPHYTSSKQLHTLGRKVAAGVVSKLDEAIAGSSLYQFV
ncbi:MAG: hypothetical protein R3321_09540, partial [Nitrososphaeraceae archaeon]|nr:hypothetical protein [Nitrososphaeraceae archaeon]